jgi:hypothetical protein
MKIKFTFGHENDKTNGKDKIIIESEGFDDEAMSEFRADFIKLCKEKKH